MLSTEEAASVLGVSTWALIYWRRGGVQRNGLAFARQGRRVVYRHADVLAFKATRAAVQITPLAECAA
jgi:aminoglycoside phosphotransferase (APT) family kinase protein